MEPIVDWLKKLSVSEAVLIPTDISTFYPFMRLGQKMSLRPRVDTMLWTVYASPMLPMQNPLVQRNLSLILFKLIQSWRLITLDQIYPTLNGRYKQQPLTFLDQEPYVESKATLSAIKDALTKATVVHFVCHSTANLNEPLDSGLLMYDGLFTLRDVLDINLTKSGGLRLAILSACETGLAGS